MPRHPNARLTLRWRETLVYRAAGNRAADAVLEYSLRGRGGFACGGFGRAAHLVLCACEHEAPVIRADVIPPMPKRGLPLIRRRGIRARRTGWSAR